jgi:hypothetical protein
MITLPASMLAMASIMIPLVIAKTTAERVTNSMNLHISVFPLLRRLPNVGALRAGRLEVDPLGLPTKRKVSYVKDIKSDAISHIKKAGSKAGSVAYNGKQALHYQRPARHGVDPL